MSTKPFVPWYRLMGITLIWFYIGASLIGWTLSDLAKFIVMAGLVVALIVDRTQGKPIATTKKAWAYLAQPGVAKRVMADLVLYQIPAALRFLFLFMAVDIFLSGNVSLRYKRYRSQKEKLYHAAHTARMARWGLVELP